MPSFAHEILVDLFRECGPLAPELLGRCAGIAIEHSRVEHRSIDLSQVVSTDYLSPPASLGTRSTGVTGIQGPTRWRADGSSP